MKTCMSTNVIVGQEFTESIGICNGLYQDNTMIPVLFSLYFGAIVDEWRSKFFLFHYPTRDLQGSLKLMEQGVTIFT